MLFWYGWTETKASVGFIQDFHFQFRPGPIALQLRREPELGFQTHELIWKSARKSNFKKLQIFIIFGIYIQFTFIWCEWPFFLGKTDLDSMSYSKEY